jgi:hypothetical protein
MFMKRPATIKELVWKYMSATQEQKDKFGNDAVVPASDLFNSLLMVEKSMKINCDMAQQSAFLLKFLMDNHDKFESHEFRILINNVRVSLEGLVAEAKSLDAQYNALVNFK